MIEPINNAFVDIPTQVSNIKLFFFVFFITSKIDRAALSGKQFKYFGNNFLILRVISSHLFFLSIIL